MKTPRKPLVFDLNRSPTTDDEVARVTAAQATPKPPVARQQLGTRIPVEVYKRFKIMAVMEGVLVQDLLERAITEFLERNTGMNQQQGSLLPD